MNFDSPEPAAPAVAPRAAAHHLGLPEWPRPPVQGARGAQDRQRIRFPQSVLAGGAGCRGPGLHLHVLSDAHAGERNTARGAWRLHAGGLPGLQRYPRERRGFAAAGRRQKRRWKRAAAGSHRLGVSVFLDFLLIFCCKSGAFSMTPHSTAVECGQSTVYFAL